MNKDLAEEAEIKFEEVIEFYHKKGLNYWEILRLLPEIMTSLIIRADVEYHLKSGQ